MSWVKDWISSLNAHYIYIPSFLLKNWFESDYYIPLKFFSRLSTRTTKLSACYWPEKVSDGPPLLNFSISCLRLSQWVCTVYILTECWLNASFTCRFRAKTASESTDFMGVLMLVMVLEDPRLFSYICGWFDSSLVNNDLRVDIASYFSIFWMPECTIFS